MPNISSLLSWIAILIQHQITLSSRRKMFKASFSSCTVKKCPQQTMGFTIGHSDNLEFSEISEFLESKIPSSKLSLFALYRKTITRIFFLREIFTLKAKFQVPSYRYLPYTEKTITRNFFLREIFTLKAKFRVPSYRCFQSENLRHEKNSALSFFGIRQITISWKSEFCSRNFEQWPFSVDEV